MNNDILAICSSRGRPRGLLKMFKTFSETKKSNIKLVVYVSETDPKIDEYKQLPDELLCNIEFGPSKYLVEVYNYFSVVKYPEFGFYQELHDDHECLTDGWDIKMRQTIIDHNGWGMCVPNDTIDVNFSSKNPGGYMISSNIVQTLGFLLYPPLTHIMTDTVLRSILIPLNLMYFRQDIIIDHVCWHDGLRGFGVRAPEDDTAKWVYNTNTPENYAAHVAMSSYNSAMYVEKLKNAINIDLSERV